jgi:hypothetical protein
MLTIEHKRPFVTKLGRIRIIPGTNVISAEDEAIVRSRPNLMAQIRDNIACGLWADVTPKEEPKAIPVVGPDPIVADALANDHAKHSHGSHKKGRQ